MTLTEVRATAASALREQLLALVGDFLSLPIEREARDLAHEYVGRGVFSPATAIDALHVAIAVNILAGYPSIEILAPPEV